MKRYDIRVSIFLIMTTVLLLLNLLVLNITSRIIILGELIGILLIALLIFKYRKGYHLERKGVSWIFIVIGIIQIAFYYAMGFIDGFSQNIVVINWFNLFNLILPFTASIIIAELLRYIMLRENSDNELSNFLIVVILVLIDVNLYGGFNNNTFNDLSKMLEFCGLTLFPSIASNVVFNKITLNYGYRSIIYYRILTILGYYISPVVPNFNVLLRSLGKMIVPIFIYFQITYMYDRTSFEAVVKKDARDKTILTIIFIVATLFASLISCKFRYGLIAIGSNSMKPYVETGDAVFFQKYEKQIIDKGDIIIYIRDKQNIIHRVVEVGLFNEQYVYRTKGDSNDTIDKGYIYKENIVGIVKFRVKYIGYPSIWLKNTFKY